MARRLRALRVLPSERSQRRYRVSRALGVYACRSAIPDPTCDALQDRRYSKEVIRGIKIAIRNALGTSGFRAVTGYVFIFGWNSQLQMSPSLESLPI